MKTAITILFSLSMFSCASPSAKNLSCDSLIQSLVRKGDNEIKSWYELQIVKRTTDSIFVKVFATNQGRDTIIVSWIVLLPARNKLRDVTLYPRTKNLEIDQGTMRLINDNCISSK